MSLIFMTFLQGKRQDKKIEEQVIYHHHRRRRIFSSHTLSILAFNKLIEKGAFL